MSWTEMNGEALRISLWLLEASLTHCVGGCSLYCAFASRYHCSADPLDVASSSSEKYLPEDSLEDNVTNGLSCAVDVLNPVASYSYLWPLRSPKFRVKAMVEKRALYFASNFTTLPSRFTPFLKIIHPG
ncbi:hypothetical protein CC2G_011540 [Coprinopsis cinerea AmutBmut pab1-1]|nr:hypothetical protein CC2G_011540 [Coprinopsis cinerea AmutBmut pab1-1]